MKISIKKLKSIAQENMSHEWNQYPFMFRIIRKFSIYLTWILVHTKISPNAITLSGIVASYLGLISLMFNQYILSIVFFIYTVLSDFSDGEVSRYENSQSKEGTYLDKLHHLHTTFVFLAAVLVYQYLNTNHLEFLFFSFLLLPFSILFPFSLTYGIDVSEITHLRYLIKGKRYNNLKIKYSNDLDLNKYSKNFKNNKKIAYGDIIYSENKFRHYIIVLFNLSRYWGFPYIFVTYGFSFCIDYLFFEGQIVFSRYLTILYTLTFPILTYFYAWRVLKNKLITKRFNENITSK